MSRLPDGREKVLTFALPLPLSLVGPLLRAVGEGLEGQGWTAVHYHQDGYVVATPPARDTDPAETRP